MRKIVQFRKVRCRETRDRFLGFYDNIQLYVADMVDGTSFYTTKDGTEIFGTDEKIGPQTDIADIFDFQTIHVDGGVGNEEEFQEIVEREAVIDKKLVIQNDNGIKIAPQY